MKHMSRLCLPDGRLGERRVSLKGDGLENVGGEVQHLHKTRKPNVFFQSLRSARE